MRCEPNEIEFYVRRVLFDWNVAASCLYSVLRKPEYRAFYLHKILRGVLCDVSL